MLRLTGGGFVRYSVRCCCRRTHLRSRYSVRCCCSEAGFGRQLVSCGCCSEAAFRATVGSLLLLIGGGRWWQAVGSILLLIGGGLGQAGANAAALCCAGSARSPLPVLNHPSRSPVSGPRSSGSTNVARQAINSISITLRDRARARRCHAGPATDAIYLRIRRSQPAGWRRITLRVSRVSEARSWCLISAVFRGHEHRCIDASFATRVATTEHASHCEANLY